MALLTSSAPSGSACASATSAWENGVRMKMELEWSKNGLRPTSSALSRLYALSPRAIGHPVRNMLSPLVRLPGTCSLPSCNWSPSQEHALSPRAIGHLGESYLCRLGFPTPGSTPAPSTNFSLSRLYALSPRAIGHPARNMLSPL
eukprot:1194855-Prorocentrum_minimum.AAC.4